MKKRIKKKVNDVKEKVRRFFEDVIISLTPKKLVPIRARGDDRKHRGK